MFRHFNPHRWTDPDDLRDHLCLGPEVQARESRIGEDYLLPRFTDGNPTSNMRPYGFDCRTYIWRHSGMGALMPSMIDTYD